MDVYRSEPREPQFICVVCYRSMAVHAGECPTCGVERLPLSDPQVRAEVRAEAERRVQNRLYGEWFWSYLAAFILAVPVRFLVGDILKAMVLWVTAGVVVGALNVKLYERLNARSMMRLVAERRRRFALATAPGGQAPKLLPPVRADDPEDAELPRVLALLGARVDGQ